MVQIPFKLTVKERYTWGDLGFTLLPLLGRLNLLPIRLLKLLQETTVMDIIYPVFCLVMLTFILAFATGISRLMSVRRKQINPNYYVLLSGDTPPDYVQKIGRNFANLLEVPVLFYLLAVLVITLQVNNALLLNLAWFYVALRLAHTIIHVSYNHVMHRFMVFVLSVLTLLVMWIQLFMLMG